MQSVQSVAEQGLSVAMMKMQVCWKLNKGNINLDVQIYYSSLLFSLNQEISGQQTSSSESEYDFPQDDATFQASEFREEGGEFVADQPGSSEEGSTNHGTATGESHVSGIQSIYEGYKDPSKQFTGQIRSYHHDSGCEFLLISQLYSSLVFLFCD